MRKLQLLLAFAIVLAPWFAAANSKAAETQVNVDQYYLIDSGNAVTISTYGWAQIFTAGLANASDPNINRLSSVHVRTQDEVPGDGITLTVADRVTGERVVDRFFQRMGGDPNWESFYFTPKVPIVAGHKYIIILECTNAVTKWVWNTSPGYTGGTRIQGEEAFAGDFGFMTWGNTYTQDTPNVVVVPPTTEEEEETTTPPAQEVSTKDSTDTGTDAVTETTTNEATKTAPPVLDESSEVEPPVLEKLINNSENVSLPVEENTEFRKNDKLVLEGTAPENSTVIVSIADHAFNTDVDGDGNWTLDMDLVDLAYEDYTVMAQTQIDDAKGSEKVEFFKFRLVQGDDVSIQIQADNDSEESLSSDDVETEESSNSVMLVIVICLACLGLLFILLGLLLLAKSEKFRRTAFYKRYLGRKNK